MSNPQNASRRQFLKTSSLVAAGTTLASGLSIARSAHASSSQKFRVAIIGCGGRGTGAGANALNASGYDIEIVAVADAFLDKAKGCVEKLAKQYKDKVKVAPDAIFGGFDSYKKAIDHPDVNYVILAGPPGFRPPHYKYAIEKGKNVFMEKPVCVDAPGFRSVMETNKLADSKGLKVGVGLQRHHQASYVDVVKRLQDGAIGDILFSRAYWNGGAIWIRERKPEMNELQYQVHNWYHFVWLCGDNICEQHVHNLDVCNWVKNDHPISANGMGGCQVRYTGKNKGVGQIFDHHAVEFTYKDGSKMFSQCRQIPGCWNSVSEAIHGTKGESNPASWIKPVGGAEYKAQGKGTNPYDQEHVDLLKAIVGNEKYNEGYFGATSTFTAVLGRMAVYSGNEVTWDDAVANGTSDMPTDLETAGWEAKPTVVKNDQGDYPIPTPGVYKAYPQAKSAGKRR